MSGEVLRIGVDIGGTKTRLGLVTPGGEVIAEKTIPTASGVTCAEHVTRISSSTRQLLADSGKELSDVRTIGVGVPGTADPNTGVVEYCPNLGWDREPLADHLESHLDIRPHVLQDSRAAAWAERLFGVEPSVESFLAVTVGTGIGCGIVLNNELLMGAMNTAGELGHSTLYRNGRQCSCGNRGCVEQYVSGTAILRRALEAFPDDFGGRPILTQTVFALAAEGHPPAQRLLEEALDDLAHAVVNAVNILSVEAVILSGGLCVYEELFVSPLRTRVLDLAYEPWRRQHKMDVFASRLGPSAPMIGAAFLDTALHQQRPIASRHHPASLKGHHAAPPRPAR
ncbi:ROK family protein [Actinotalea sp. K2]|uniref:ROK family protein n=1 Tax=Actinotalea sp. K2 TaxID=2939438 RepID=UPI0020183535|nr:ROK family protein [Actinotalea sp. K2]MCL3863307.1 ROK family protein [Actinotalea sp. K2]